MMTPILFDVYKDKRGEWRWRASHHNGRIMCDSSEGYKRRWGAKRALEKFIHVIEMVGVEIKDEIKDA